MTGFRGVVFGWYHQRNAGDDRFAHCIERWLHDHELIFLPHTEPPPLEVLRRADYVILGCGSIANSVHGVFSRMSQWIAKAKLPVFGIGLTVSLDEHLRTELRSVVESGGALWLRDQPSADWLQFDRNVVVGPDITWLYPRTFAGVAAPNTIGVNFRSWPLREWDPHLWGRQLKRDGNRLIPWPLCFGKDDDRPVIAQVVGEPVSDDEFVPSLPAQVSLVVAMRFHAVIFSLQTGTPVVPIANSKKLQWLLGQLELGHLSVPVESPDQFHAAAELARATLTAEALGELTNQLRAEAWRVADQFRDRIQIRCPSKRKSRSTSTQSLVAFSSQELRPAGSARVVQTPHCRPLRRSSANLPVPRTTAA